MLLHLYLTRPQPVIHLAALSVALVFSGTSAAAKPSVIVQTFTAGGIEQQLQLQPAASPEQGANGRVPNRIYAPVRLPVTAQALDFRITPNPASTQEPIRTQYKLIGWDDDWRDVEGLMALMLRFLDDQGRRVGGESFTRSGRSSGWSGDPRTTPFRTRSEMTIPPTGTQQMQLSVAAGGPPTTGTWLEKSIRVFASPGNGRPEELLQTLHIDEGDDLHRPLGLPAGWRREGSTASIAQVIALQGDPGSAPEHTLAVIDHDAQSTGRWAAFGQNMVKVQAGIPLRIETEEAFSIGAGGDFTCTYQKLPRGRYRLQVIPVDEFGVQAGVGVEVPFTLIPPFYTTWWFWAIVGLIAISGVAGGVRYATNKRMHRRFEQLERRRAVEAERMRIAQDIHDDMGARLTQISLASGLALRKSAPDSAAIDDLRKLDRTARDVASALDEIVWAINPEHDALDGLANYISQYVTEATADSTVRCRLEIPALLPAHFISSGVRHHILMALKEALNNALKHSGGTEVRVQLAFNDPVLTLVVADNGRGFDPAAASSRNGIANMRRRLESVGGHCEFESAADRGTRVRFHLELSTKESP